MIFPKAIRQNNRFRGPYESQKINSVNSSIEIAVNELNKELESLNKKLTDFKKKNSVDRYCKREISKATIKTIKIERYKYGNK